MRSQLLICLRCGVERDSAKWLVWSVVGSPLTKATGIRTGCRFVRFLRIGIGDDFATRMADVEGIALPFLPSDEGRGGLRRPPK